MGAGRVLGVLLVVGGLTLTVVGLAGASGAFGRPSAALPSPTTAASPSSPPAGPTESAVAVPSPTPTPAPTAAPTTDVDALVRAFFVELETALRDGRAGDMVDALAPAVFERYGREACDAQLGSQAAEPGRGIEVLSVGTPADWAYETDDRSTTVDDAIAVQARVSGPTPSGDATVERELHVQLVDGTVRWFSDCGTPLG